MKKIIYTSMLILVGTGLAQAQKTYVAVKGGYSFNISPYYDRTSSTDVNGVETTTANPVGFGSGFNGTVAIGHMFNNTVGIELSGGYFSASPFSEYTSTQEQPSPTGTYNPSWYYNESDKFSNITMLCITPALVLKTSFNKWSIFGTFGPTFGLAGKITESYSSKSYQQAPSPSTSYTAHSDESTYEYSGGYSFGIKGSIGAEYAFTEKIGLFAEALYTGLGYTPAKRMLTVSTTDGVDNMPNKKTNDIETDFVSNYTTSPAPPDPNSPRQQTKISFPFSGLAFNVGIKFYLK